MLGKFCLKQANTRVWINIDMANSRHGDLRARVFVSLEPLPDTEFSLVTDPVSADARRATETCNIPSAPLARVKPESASAKCQQYNSGQGNKLRSHDIGPASFRNRVLINRTSVQQNFQLAPKRVWRGHRRQLFREFDAELDLFKLLPATTTSDQMLSHLTRLVRGQLAVKVG
jgi:hypothetical protein